MRASAPRITAVETHAALGEHEVIEIWSTARVIGSRSCRPWLPPSGAGIETGSHHIAQLRESRCSTGLSVRPKLAIAAEIEKAAQLKALPGRQLVEDESQGRAIGRARHVLGAGEELQKRWSDALQQLQVLSGQSGR